MRRVIWLVALLAGLARADLGREADIRRFDDRNLDVAPWSEEEVALPPAPVDAELMEFPVSAVATHRFFVHGPSLSVGKDGVVRFSLVVKTAGGATNVTYEGIRCKTGEYRLFATGRADGTWAVARSKDWRAIENKVANRHHAALSRDFFCPIRAPIASADEGRDALRRGRHPLAPDASP